MKKPTLTGEIAAICLLIALFTQIVLGSSTLSTEHIQTPKDKFFLKGTKATNPYNLPIPAATPEQLKGFINPAKISKGERNNAVAFIPPKCDEKWEGKKLRIVAEDKDNLGRSGIEISENADFVVTNFKRCKAVANIDTNENSAIGSYRIRFFPQGSETQVVEANLEVAEVAEQTAETNTHSAVQNSDKENGITVGKPKQFDERTLALMLQGLESKLAQSQFPDPGGLYGNVGRFGGATANTSSMALSVRGPSIPSIATTVGSTTADGTTSSSTNGTNQTTTNTTNIGPTDTTSTSSSTTGNTTSNTSGNTSGMTSNMQQVTTQAAIAPPAVALPGQTSLYSYQPQFGIASQDLLTEQTSLFYQIVNLRMLLDRSLTDRIKVKPGIVGATDITQFASTDYIRDQIVIGFQISINAAYKDAVAEAEITINSEDVSLVSLLPQEKTYNVASVTKDSKAIDAGAVVQFIGVGGAVGKTQESMYLVKDTDTIALERKSTGTKVKFAWQFRPVLGRKTVEPGVRQVYALISVPNINETKGVDTTGVWKGEVTATTSWRKYDKKTKTVGNLVKGTNEVSQYVNFLLPIGDANTTDSGLKPVIRNLSSQDVGNGQVLIVAEGEGFTRDSNVVVGNKILSRPEDGLTIANERRLMLLATGQSLASTSPLLVSRYGTSSFNRNLKFCYTRDVCIDVNEPYFGRSLIVRGIKARDSVSSEITVRLISDDKEILDKAGKKKRYIEDFEYLFRHHPPVIIIGGKIFGFSDAPFISKKYKDSKNPNEIFPECGTDKWCGDLTFVAPTQLLANNSFLTFKEFLWDKGSLTANLPSQKAFTVSDLKVLGANGEKTQLAIVGGGFTSNVRVFVGDAEFGLKCSENTTPDTTSSADRCISAANELTLQPKGGSPTVIILSPTKIQIKDVKHILITQEGAQPQTFALTPPSQDAFKAKIISPSPFVISSGSSKREKLEGVNLEAIKKITTLDGKEVFFELDKKDKTILFLEIPESLTSRAGEKHLKLIMKDDTQDFLTIVVK